MLIAQLAGLQMTMNPIKMLTFDYPHRDDDELVNVNELVNDAWIEKRAVNQKVFFLFHSNQTGFFCVDSFGPQTSTWKVFSPFQPEKKRRWKSDKTNINPNELSILSREIWDCRLKIDLVMKI
jgi:hypothetical protein